MEIHCWWVRNWLLPKLATECLNSYILYHSKPCLIHLDTKKYLGDSMLFKFQVFEVAPSLHIVEVRKTGGDTLEFNTAC